MYLFSYLFIYLFQGIVCNVENNNITLLLHFLSFVGNFSIKLLRKNVGNSIEICIIELMFVNYVLEDV